MKERPILFNAPMVRALLNCTKSQTRRVVNPQPSILSGDLLCWKDNALNPKQLIARCPHGHPGDRLWVRERFRALDCCCEVDYYAGGRQVWERMQDNIELPDAVKWKPSIHMPRWASRITLEIAGVRVEQLQSISEADAEAEGVDFLRHIPDVDETLTANQLYECLWESINGPGSWAANPWVWVVEFKRVKGGA